MSAELRVETRLIASVQELGIRNTSPAPSSSSSPLPSTQHWLNPSYPLT
ncbi:hypothetical protein [Nostoc sp.]